MKIFLHNRKDIKVFQNSMPLKVYYSGGNEYVMPQVDEQGHFEVEFVKKSEFSGALWFLRALFFWIIGIMGFFTPKYAKCNHSLNCKVSGTNVGESINVSFIHPNPKFGVGTAVKVREQNIEIQGEKYVIDAQATKRKKLYTALSVLLRLAVVVLIVYLIIKLIIG